MEKKENKSIYNIKSFLLICNSISIGTNLILFLLFFMAEHLYKYLGIGLHSLLIILGIISLYFLFISGNNKSKLKNYKLTSNYYFFLIYISFFFILGYYLICIYINMILTFFIFLLVVLFYGEYFIGF